MGALRFILSLGEKKQDRRLIKAIKQTELQFRNCKLLKRFNVFYVIIKINSLNYLTCLCYQVLCNDCNIFTEAMSYIHTKNGKNIKFNFLIQLILLGRSWWGKVQTRTPWQHLCVHVT